MNVINYEKSRLHIIVIFIVFFCLFMSQILLAFDINNHLPKMMSFKYRNGTDVDIVKLESVENTSGLSQSMGIARSLYIEEPAMIMATGDDYAQITGMRLLRGSYFTAQGHPMENRVVVIGEKLSLQLYKTHESVGQEIELNDIKYTICGVYRQEKSLLKDMSYGNDEVVYVPLLSDFKPQKLGEIIIKSDAEIAQSAADTIGMGIADRFNFEYAVNYSSVRHLVSQSVRLTMLICGIPVCIWLVIAGINRIKRCKTWKERAKHSPYFVLLIILLLFIQFKLYIPYKWFPNDNIFDFPFYYSQLIELFHNKNTYSAIIDNFWNYSLTAVPLCFGIGIASIIVFFCGFTVAITAKKGVD